MQHVVVVAAIHEVSSSPLGGLLLLGGDYECLKYFK